MFYRTLTSQLRSDLDSFPIIGLVGPGQVGKTTLARYIESTTQIANLYLNLAAAGDRRRLTDAPKFLKSHSDKCIVIDNIQKIPELLPLIRDLVDLAPFTGRFILIATNRHCIDWDNLAQRAVCRELSPLSLLEISPENEQNLHWLRGGFPKALLAAQTSSSQKWLCGFIQDFISQDLGYIVSQNLMERLLSMLTLANGNVLNMSDLARSLGVSQPTINRYLDILEHGFIITRLLPYTIDVKKRIIRAPKIYIRDSGILHSLANITSSYQLMGHPMVGASFEGYVIEQIRRVAPAKWQYYFYRTQKNAESDLVIVSNSGKKICIEINLSNTAKISRGFHESIKDIEPHYSFVIVQECKERNEGNIVVCNLARFLHHYLTVIL